MKKQLTKLAVVTAVACSTLVGQPKAEAGIGVISLIGGPGGIAVIQAGLGVTLGGTAAVLGYCYVFDRKQTDCPVLANVPFWGGLILLDQKANIARDQIFQDLITVYGADQASASRIADRIYNKSLSASIAESTRHEEQNLEADARQVLRTQISITADELSQLAEANYVGTAGFAKLVQDCQ